ncbi:gastric intrinsic factor-like protein 1 [Plakobranchus ocellatus]|uniref:Gastric intrinsic factor-like protein 1 n=1 Tax=Plakobranchus ocellatus TaxID=259542 RepID=A0AAV3YBT1_9GAST|nr:gastric intrinsic factor-like protein 1 [Plakobranchus ocellatus]
MVCSSSTLLVNINLARVELLSLQVLNKDLFFLRTMADLKDDNTGAESKPSVENPPGDDRSFIDMTIIVRNKFQEPFFEYEHTLTNWPQRILLHALEDWAKEDKHFWFCVEYFEKLRYMITAFKKQSQSTENRTYWSISSNIAGSLTVGVSKYIPQNKEVITFNFQSYSSHEDCGSSDIQTK